MEFKRIEKQNIADQVFHILRQEILEGSFQPGDRLPPEGKLSEDLGVSKSSVRVAIQRLVTLGLVETRAGQGSFVREFNANNYLDQMYEFLLTDNDMKQITEYRLAVEMACTELAAQKAEPADFERLEQLVRKMNQAMIAYDVPKHGKYDYEFHLEICKITKNQVFVISYEVIGKMLRQHTTKLNEFYLKKAVSNKAEEDVHWRLIQAMREKDMEACRNCYIEMFSVYEESE